jgi:hypothetical protein
MIKRSSRVHFCSGVLLAATLGLLMLAASHPNAVSLMIATVNAQSRKRVTKDLEANQGHVVHLRTTLHELAHLSPGSTFVRRDNHPVSAQWNNYSQGRETAPYTCDQLELYEPTAEYGLKYQEARRPTPPTGNGYCESWYMSYAGDYGSEFRPPQGKWMLGRDGKRGSDWGNSCVRSVVEKCRVTEREFVQSVLNEYLTTLKAVIDDQLLIDNAIAAVGAGNGR